MSAQSEVSHNNSSALQTARGTPVLNRLVPAPAARFLSQAECATLAAQVASFREGGGESRVQIESWWRGTMRFARNEIQSSGDRRNTDIMITRNVEGAERVVVGNQIDAVSVRAMVRRAERMLKFDSESGDIRFQTHIVDTTDRKKADNAEPDAAKSDSTFDMMSHDNPHPDVRRSHLLNLTALTPEPYEHPKLLFESTLAMSSPQRAAAVAPLVAGAVKAGMHAAGDFEVRASGTALMDTWGRHLYYPMTEAYYTVTVRSPDGTASGWAGVDGNDWNRIDGVRLSEIALEKCLQSRNPVRIEPGRYTTILEPQAVHQLFWPIIASMNPPFDDPSLAPPPAGKKSIDERITVTADPMDPDAAFLPFDLDGNVYHKATWFDRGLTKDFPHTRNYAIHRLGTDTGLPNGGAYHMASGTTSLAEMIATTDRGILVTHFHMITGGVPPLNIPAEGYTRDGTWLVEKGKVTKPIKNLKFRVLQYAQFNNVEQVGPSQRVYSRAWADCPAAVVPPMKLRDFNFTALTDAI